MFGLKRQAATRMFQVALGEALGEALPGLNYTVSVQYNDGYGDPRSAMRYHLVWDDGWIITTCSGYRAYTRKKHGYMTFHKFTVDSDEVADIAFWYWKEEV